MKQNLYELYRHVAFAAMAGLGLESGSALGGGVGYCGDGRTALQWYPHIDTELTFANFLFQKEGCENSQSMQAVAFWGACPCFSCRKAGGLLDLWPAGFQR